jgi:predicted dehydrogenase
MSRSKARLAVIGTGWWGTEYHLPGILAHPEAELVAICDTQPGRLQKAAETYHPRRSYRDHKSLLAEEELDGVVIVTPHATHYPIARDCQKRGLHLLIEKPMTLHAWEARHLVQTAQARGLELVVGYPFHYLPQTRRARQAVQSGELGAVQYIACSFASNVIGFLQGNVSTENPPHRFTVLGPGQDYNRPELLGGGEGHLQITHTAALMLFITGLRIRQVSAQMNNYGLKVDLVDAMSIQFEGGAVCSLGGTANAGSAYNVLLSVYCERGAYTFDSLARHAALHKPGAAAETLPSTLQGAQPYAVTRNFINLILGREENGSPGETGWRTVELLDAAYRSAAQDGRPVLVEELYSERSKG